MKKGFYALLARDGMKKNRQLYIPYILTCIGMIMMFYIIAALCYSPTLDNMRGGDDAKFCLMLGRWVIAVFSVLFLFYTNSFLIRRRKKEFGLYNILGMGKRNISYIILWESVFTALISLAAGLAFGIVLFKFAELGLFNAIGADINYSLSLSKTAIIQTIELYTAIFVLLLLNTLLQVRRYNPLALLHSENIGEKPPKANRLFAVLGFIILAFAYYIAISIKSPLAALVMFFAAVIMVIMATYLLFIAGSVTFCRILQKNKNYYYNPKHFVSVSSMAYRMKRNGAGLASICILSTMVLVMISSTASLYICKEDSLRTIYPRDISVYVQADNADKLNERTVKIFKDVIYTAAEINGAKPENYVQFPTAAAWGKLNGGRLENSRQEYDENIFKYENSYYVYIISLSDYNKLMNANETLGADEALIYSTKRNFDQNIITIGDAKPLKVKKVLSKFENIIGMNSLNPSIFVITADFENYIKPLTSSPDDKTKITADIRWYCAYDTAVSEDTQIQIFNSTLNSIKGIFNENKYGISGYNCESAAVQRASFYATYGGLFFLGIALSIVFIFAAALMIYYKQLSEGYEDMERFKIMQNVGMTKNDIRKSINSQILTVFFAPLIFAGLHLSFAFPLLWKILQMFNLQNLTLLIITSVCCFFTFALLYTFVYRITSNEYYKIVSDAKKI